MFIRPVIVLCSLVIAFGDEQFNLTMPGVTPKTPDAYYCSTQRLNRTSTFLTNFVVHSSMEIAHHILLYGCKIPYTDIGAWPCGQICQDGAQKIIYAWARNASQFSYPKDVGYKVGEEVNIDYLVLQVHYLNPVKVKDFSYITISYTTVPPKYEAGMHLMLAFSQAIPPRMPAVHVDISCVHQGPDIHPFAFRTHAHSLGRVISGFVIKQDQPNDDVTWIKIGLGSPQWPQAFYPTTEGIVIKNGDILAARCTYNSLASNTTVYMGATHLHEMCNFYMMYYVESRNHLIQAASTQQQSSFSPPPSHIYANDMCEDQGNLPNPMIDNPFQTDPPELMNVTVPDMGGMSSKPADMKHTMSILEVNRSFFANLSLAANSRVIQLVELGITTTRDAFDVGLGNEIHKDHHSLALPGNDGERPAPGSKFSHEKPPDLITTSIAKNFKPTVIVDNWPPESTEKLMGPVSAIDIQMGKDLNSDIVYILHRDSNIWDMSTFNDNTYVYNKQNEPAIKTSTILALNTTDGTIVAQTGSDMFYMPHGLSVDGDGNIWVTDVALHQVYKLSPLIGSKSKVLLTLGQKFIPGSDASHFCKPTDVAILPSGDFFVSDGYCNSRIIKFRRDGQFLMQYGQSTTTPALRGPFHGKMNIPHSLALVNVHQPSDPSMEHPTKLLFIADRENGRVICLELLNEESLIKVDPSLPPVRCPPLVVSTVQRGAIYALHYLPVVRTPQASLFDIKTDSAKVNTEDVESARDLQGYLFVLQSRPLNMFENLPPTILIYALRSTDLFAKPENVNSVHAVASLVLKKIPGVDKMGLPHDITAQFSPDDLSLHIYVSVTDPNLKKLWKFTLTASSLAAHEPLGVAESSSRRPSVKKAGVSVYVSMPNDISGNSDGISAEGDTEQLGNSATNVDANGNDITLSKDKGVDVKNSTLLTAIKHKAGLNLSTFIIILALGIPIILTCVIIAVMRNQSKKAKFLKFSPLRDHSSYMDDYDDHADFLVSKKSRPKRNTYDYYDEQDQPTAKRFTKGIHSKINHLTAKVGLNNGISSEKTNFLSRILGRNNNRYKAMPPTSSTGHNSHIQFKPLNSASNKLHYYYDSEGSSIYESDRETRPKIAHKDTQPTPKTGINMNKKDLKSYGVNPGSLNGRQVIDMASEEDDVLDLKDYYSTTNGTGAVKTNRIGIERSKKEADGMNNLVSPITLNLSSSKTARNTKTLSTRTKAGASLSGNTGERTRLKNGFQKKTNSTNAFSFGDIANIHESNSNQNHVQLNENEATSIEFKNPRSVRPIPSKNAKNKTLLVPLETNGTDNNLLANLNGVDKISSSTLDGLSDADFTSVENGLIAPSQQNNLA